MDHGPLRALTLELNLSVHGVPVTVTRPAPDNAPIATRGIWVTPVSELLPRDLELQRREPVRIMALSRTEVPTVPRGTTIVGPERAGGTNRTWRVDGTERTEADTTRVIVVPVI